MIEQKRKWTAEERRQLAAGEIEGAFAGPDQSFPIASSSDVGDAWGLAGHADNPDKVRRRIISIARKYGWLGGLPGAASQFVNCKAFYNGAITQASGQGFYNESSRVQFTGCQAQQNYSHGFQFVTGSNYVLVVGCKADSNGRSGTTANGYEMTAGTYHLFSGCSAEDVVEGGQAYGWHINTGLDYIYIDGSFTRGNASGGLSNESAGANIDTAGLKQW